MVVTGETIYIFFLAEIEVGILPAVAGMTRSTLGPITFDANTKVIDQVLLAEALRLGMPGYHNFVTQPCPVGSLHYFLGAGG